MGKPVIHVAYILDACDYGTFKLCYTHSTNNGVTWSTPKILESNSYRVKGVTGMCVVGSRIYITFRPALVDNPVKVLYTDDCGQSFSLSKPINKHENYISGTSLYACSDKGKGAMASLLVSSRTIEYSVWNTTSQIFRPYPSTDNIFRNAAMACTVDAEKSLLNVIIFSETELNNVRKVYFAKESFSLPAQTRDVLSADA